MVHHYYLVASLPLLSFGEEAPLSNDQFLQACREWLNRRDLKAVEAASLTPFEDAKPASAIQRSWWEWEAGLRNQLVRLRARQKNLEPEPYLRAVSSPEGLYELAREAFDEQTPIASEEILAKARWNRLEQLELGHYFDTERLILYALKLQLLGWMALFDREEGAGVFGRLREAKVEQIKMGESPDE